MDPLPPHLQMDWPLILLGAWVAATISGAAGFGGALLLLPILSHAIGGKAAVPVLTIAQLLGNLSRAGFGWREIRWRAALLFCAGAVPASMVEALLFRSLSAAIVSQGIAVFLLMLVVLRSLSQKREAVLPEKWLPGAGILVGFLSGTAGSAGPLGAAFFLSLRLLPTTAYATTEAVAATLMHSTKTLVYGRYALLTLIDCGLGLAVGAAMVVGSWSGRRIVECL